MGWPRKLPYRQKTGVYMGWSEKNEQCTVKVRKRGKTKKKQFYGVRMKLEVLLRKIAFHNICMYIYICTCIFRHTYLFVIILIFCN